MNKEVEQYIKENKYSKLLNKFYNDLQQAHGYIYDLSHSYTHDKSEDNSIIDAVERLVRIYLDYDVSRVNVSITGKKVDCYVVLF